MFLWSKNPAKHLVQNFASGTKLFKKKRLRSLTSLHLSTVLGAG